MTMNPSLWYRPVFQVCEGALVTAAAEVERRVGIELEGLAGQPIVGFVHGAFTERVGQSGKDWPPRCNPARDCAQDLVPRAPANTVVRAESGVVTVKAGISPGWSLRWIASLAVVRKCGGRSGSS